MGHAVVGIPDDDGIEKANQHLSAKDRETRTKAAVAMKIRGVNYSKIAEVLGYVSPTQARQAVERSLAASAGPDERAQQRHLESRRLERLLRSVWKKATDDEGEEHLAYVRAALAIIDRHARLVGADAPQEMVVYNPTQREMDEWIATMVKQVNGEMPQEYDVIEGVAIDDDPIGDVS
jgi:hypothetical protein